MNNINLKEQFLGFYNTPSLFVNDIYGIGNFEFDKIDLSNINFLNLEIKEQIPLGKRIERFFEFYILNSNRYDLILKNIQVIENKHILGEIDFIIFDKKYKEYVHVELVYKYYIYEKRFSKELGRYIGPNRNVTLIKKLTKLKNKQFPLLFREETKRYLSNIDLNNIKQKLCFKANLYYLEEDFNNSFDFINNGCKKGIYIKYKDFIENDSFRTYEYFMPHRFDWVSSVNIVDSWFSYEGILEMIETCHNLKTSPLVWIRNSNSLNYLFITYQ